MKLKILLRICFFICLIIFLTYSFIKIPVVTHGFTSYYTLSRILLSGDDLEKSYDSTYFNSKVKEYGIKDVYDIHYNIPTGAFMLLPVAWLPPGAAKIMWGILSLLFLSLSVKLLLGAYEISVRENIGILILILILIWRPVYLNLALGQIYLFLLLLFCISLKGIKRNSDLAASIPISLSFLLKGYSWIFLLWFLAKRKWKAVSLTLLFIILGFLLTLPVIKWSVWETYWNVLTNSIGRYSTDSFVAYQNINSFIRHLFVFDNDLNPHAVLSLSSAVVFIIVIVLDLALFLIIAARSFKGNALISFSAFLGLAVITAPIAEEHSYVLFLPLAIFLFKDLFKRSKKITLTGIIYALAVLLIALPLDYKSLQFSTFPLWLLAYPKLYAGIILLICYYIMTKPGVTINEH